MNDVAQNETRQLAPAQPIGNLAAELGGYGLPPSLQILLNDGLYDRVKQLAGVMSKAVGFTPGHLLSKPEACFAVINMSLDWKLSPHFVARHTYQTPGGAIGYDGALVQAILERSGQFIGAPQIEYRGDWSSLTGKFKIVEGTRGGKFPVPTWTSQDATGLGIIVRWRVRGEDEARAWPGENEPFWLTQCFPLNSPLWATDPKTQIAYLGIRRFANIAAPGILGAASFDREAWLDASERAIDVTPQNEPSREDFVDEQRRPEHEPQFPVWTLDGEEQAFGSAARARDALMLILQEAARTSILQLEGIWEDNLDLLSLLSTSGNDGFVQELSTSYADLLADLQEKAKAAAGPKRRTSRQAAPAAEASPGRGGAQAPSPSPAPGEPARGGSPSEPQGAAQASEDDAGAETEAEGEQAHSEPAAAASGAQEDDRFPGDLPAGQKLGDRSSQVEHPKTDEAWTGIAGAQQDASSSQTADAGAGDPEPEQVGDGSKTVAPVLKNGKPEWKPWLVAMATPKMKQQKSTVALASFLADNAAHLDQAKRACPAEFRDFDAALAAQWKVIEKLEASGNG